MSNQITMSDLLVDLSTEQQQFLAGGQVGDQGDSGDEESGDQGTSGQEPSVGTEDSSPGTSRRKRFFISGIVSLRKIPRWS
jgi:hypothetical protein